MPDRKLVLFDWDGTLSNVTKTLEFGLPIFSGLQGLPHDVARFSTGYFDPETVDMGWGIPLSQQRAMRIKWDIYLTENTLTDDNFVPPLYPGVTEMLAEIAVDYDMGIVTARDREPLRRMMRFHGIDTQIITYRTRDCAMENGYLVKPCPDAVLSLIAETGHSPQETVMIGDAPVDIEMANRAGVKSIAVAWGLYPEVNLLAARPTLIAQTMKDLPQMIKEILA